MNFLFCLFSILPMALSCLYTLRPGVLQFCTPLGLYWPIHGRFLDEKFQIFRPVGAVFSAPIGLFPITDPPGQSAPGSTWGSALRALVGLLIGPSPS